ncbi:MAG TPA: hypothetical protein VEW05_14270 [Candidatus Polarisedimenticolia bacterium]|nr:hypothetical protein [Candidatus Polarisedimenticolia bacterium]
MIDEKPSQPVEQHPQAQTHEVPPLENNPSSEDAAQIRRKNNEHRIANLEDRIKSAEKWMIWLTGAIAFFALCQVGVGWFQWKAMNGQLAEMTKQYPELKKSADAAQGAATTADNTLKSSEQSFRQEERAYLWATSFNMSDGPIITDAKGEHVCADVHVVNSGKTPANGVHIWRHATYGPNAERTIRAFRPPEYLTPSGDMLGTTGDKWGTAFTDPVDKASEKALLDGSIPLYVYGIVQYFDIFGDYHETGFCSHRVFGGTPFMACGFGNWFDKRPEDKNRPNNPN